MIYPHSGMFHNNIKRWNINTDDTMNESQKQYDKWKKSNIKKHYRMNLNLCEIKQRQAVAKAEQ